MALETKEQIDQFITLQKKSEEELRAICEGMHLDTAGTRDELLSRLSTAEPQIQNDILQPQAIPLRTRDDRGEIMPDVVNLLRGWRKILFNGKNNEKEFKLLNVQGQLYTRRMKYILCTEEVLGEILKRRWYDPRFTKHNDLIDQLKLHPEHFVVHIVQKPVAAGNSFIMLHAEPRKLAA